eukprot:g4184.t1
MMRSFVKKTADSIFSNRNRLLSSFSFRSVPSTPIYTNVNQKLPKIQNFQTRHFGCFASESEFKAFAGSFLEDISDALEPLEEAIGDTVEVDIEIADGVLTINLAQYGIWVLNLQGPNEQIWWSSPLSGPRRYEYKGGKWTGTRDGNELLSLLISELQTCFGKAVVDNLEELKEMRK